MYTKSKVGSNQLCNAHFMAAVAQHPLVYGPAADPNEVYDSEAEREREQATETERAKGAKNENSH